MRRLGLVLVALLPLACSLDGLDRYTSGDAAPTDAAPEDAGVDARADSTAPDASAPDAAPDAPTGPCDLGAPFGTPTALSSVNSVVDDVAGSLSPDQLTLYFTSNRNPSKGVQPFTAARTTPASPFGSVTLLPSLYFAADTWNVSVTGDGLAAYYVTDQGGADHLYKATRASTAMGFSGAAQMPAPIASGKQPYVLPDGSALYYTDSTGPTVDVVVRASLATLTTATQVLSVGAHSAGIPVVTPDELTIYFSVYDRGKLTFDIWRATRVSTSVAWGTPAPVTELNALGGFNVPAWISADGCTIYLTSATDNSSADWNMYTASHPPR